MGWDDWIEKHTTTFGLGAKDAPMLVEWAEEFQREGYTAAELAEATAWLVTHDPPAFVNQHLPRLMYRVNEERARRASAARRASRPVEPPECKLCGNTARVSVPDPRALAKGKWADLAVICKCPLGLHWAKHDKRGQRTLADYEREVPDWRERVKGHNAELLREARPFPGDLQEKLDEIMARLREAR